MYYQLNIDFTPDEVLDYLRKSRSDDPLLTVEEVLAKHEAILDEWAEQHLGGKVPEKNKFREVVSGETLKERPEIQKVLKLIESPKYKAVKVVEPQRLTRGDLEDIGKLMKLLKHTNTIVITPQRLYNLRDEYDWDAFERELKRGNDYLEYTKKILSRGKLLQVSQGCYIGSRPPFGFDKIVIEEGKKKCKTLRPNKDADTVRLIFDLYVNQNWGTTKIADHLNNMGVKPANGNLWLPEVLRDMLSNIHYIGKVRWNWRKTITKVEDSEFIKTRPRIGEYLIFDGRQDSIVTDEIFNAAQEKKGNNPRYAATRKVANPFASLLFCQCGRAMSYKPYPNMPPRLICLGKKHCKSGSCMYWEIEERICEVLKQCIEDFEIRLNNDQGDSIKLHENLIKNLEQKKKALEAKELAQWEAQADPDPSKRMPHEIFQKLNEKLLREKEEIQDALCKAYESMPEPVDYQEKLYRFRDALDALQNPDVLPEEKNRLLKACIERIIYTRDEITRLTDENGKRIRDENGNHWNKPPIYLDVKLRV